MDINKALADLRASVQDALRMGYKGTLASQDDLNNRMLDIAEGFDNLDEWLRNGGFLPRDWQGRSYKKVTS